MKRKIEMHFNGIGEKMLSNDWSIMYEKAKEFVLIRVVLWECVQKEMR